MNNVEELKNKMLELVDSYYVKYNLPPQNISDAEWTRFLTVVYDHFLAHNIIDDYEDAINIVVRRAIGLAFVGKDEFNIIHLKKALKDLIAFHIYDDEIEAIRVEIDAKIKKYQLVK